MIKRAANEELMALLEGAATLSGYKRLKRELPSFNRMAGTPAYDRADMYLFVYAVIYGDTKTALKSLARCWSIVEESVYERSEAEKEQLITMAFHSISYLMVQFSMSAENNRSFIESLQRQTAVKGELLVVSGTRSAHNNALTHLFMGNIREFHRYVSMLWSHENSRHAVCSMIVDKCSLFVMLAAGNAPDNEEYERICAELSACARTECNSHPLFPPMIVDLMLGIFMENRALITDGSALLPGPDSPVNQYNPIISSARLWKDSFTITNSNQAVSILRRFEVNREKSTYTIAEIISLEFIHSLFERIAPYLPESQTVAVPCWLKSDSSYSFQAFRELLRNIQKKMIREMNHRNGNHGVSILVRRFRDQLKRSGALFIPERHCTDSVIYDAEEAPVFAENMKVNLPRLIEDLAVGLYKEKVVVGRSSKVGSSGNGKLLGRFGIGLMSGFSAGPDISMITRAVHGDGSTLAVCCSEQGYYSVEKSSIQLSEPGTEVRVRIIHDDGIPTTADELFDAVKSFGLEVDEHIECCGRTVMLSLAPWNNHAADFSIWDVMLKRYKLENCIDMIPVQSEIAGFTGGVFILSKQTCELSFRPESLLFSMGMRVKGDHSELLPAWARSFMIIAGNTLNLTLTASRDSFMHDLYYESLREEISAAVKRWFFENSDHAIALIRKRTIPFQLLALEDRDLCPIILPHITFYCNIALDAEGKPIFAPRSSGSSIHSYQDLENSRYLITPEYEHCTFSEILAYSSDIYVVESKELFMQTASAARDRGMLVINGEILYSSQLLAAAQEHFPGMHLHYIDEENASLLVSSRAEVDEEWGSFLDKVSSYLLPYSADAAPVTMGEEGAPLVAIPVQSYDDINVEEFDLFVPLSDYPEKRPEPTRTKVLINIDSPVIHELRRSISPRVQGGWLIHLFLGAQIDALRYPSEELYQEYDEILSELVRISRATI